MTKADQRLAIAAADGFTNIRRQYRYISQYTREQCEQHGMILREYDLIGDKEFDSDDPELPGKFTCPAAVPNYLKDLNAMHDAWLTLPPEKLDSFNQNLAGVCSGWQGSIKESVFKAVNATTTQRAEAFLRTLNLWKE